MNVINLPHKPRSKVVNTNCMLPLFCPNKSNTKHYLATEMGLDNVPPKKMKRKKSPPVSLDDLPDTLGKNAGYEHRTVNSVADITMSTENEPEVPRKRLKRRKPELIDSEVDLMKTKPPRPPMNLSMLMPRNNLDAIQEHKSESDDLPVKKKKNRKRKNKSPSKGSPDKSEMMKQSSVKVKKTTPKASGATGAQVDPAEKYPVLKNHELVKRFLKVDFNNNQKGRIRQVIKDILRGTSPTALPGVINNKIQAILNSSQNLTDSDLRKIRVLYNMLKKATEETPEPAQDDTVSEDILKDKEETQKDEEGKSKGKEDKPKKEKEKKVAKEKRYVVFLGNLPIDVTRDQILSHFSDIRDYIKDVRIPPLAEDKKSSIAYVEFDNGPGYEMALSKHHSMLANRRINVLYTSPNKNSKITKTEAKAKSAKLMAMAKKGQLIGSIPLQKKRSHRRAKARAYQLAKEKELDSNSLN